MSLDVVSLFSGVGGIDLAFERAGCTPRVLCEADKHAASVLAHHWPDVPLFPDVKELTADDLRASGARPGRTVVCAGFPCQDLSVAGRRRGMGEGTRSGLFFEIVRLLRDFPARWVLLENVFGLLSHDDGRAMGAVLGALADLGYGFAYRVLDAQHFGVPQRRRRVVIVGRLGDSGAAPAEVLLEPEGGGWDSSARFPAWPGAAEGTGRGADRAGVASVVGSLTASAEGGWRVGADEAAAGQLIPTTFQKVTRPATEELVVQPLAVRGRDGGAEVEVAPAGSPSNTLRTPGGGSSHAMVCITGERTHALTAEGADASEDGAGRGTPISAATLTAGTSSPNVSVPGRRQEDDVNIVQADTTVRRLTPLECERLQGHPDGWTAIGANGPQYDAQRYKQMGNGVAVPVFEWVARRLVAVDEAREAAAA